MVRDNVSRQLEVEFADQTFQKVKGFFIVRVNSIGHIYRRRMSLGLQYISAGCNQTPHNADWNTHSVLAFGAGISVALARSVEEVC